MRRRGGGKVYSEGGVEESLKTFNQPVLCIGQHGAFPLLLVTGTLCISSLTYGYSWPGESVPWEKRETIVSKTYVLLHCPTMAKHSPNIGPTSLQRKLISDLVAANQTSGKLALIGRLKRIAIAFTYLASASSCSCSVASLFSRACTVILLRARVWLSNSCSLAFISLF